MQPVPDDAQHSQEFDATTTNLLLLPSDSIYTTRFDSAANHHAMGLVKPTTTNPPTNLFAIGLVQPLAAIVLATMPWLARSKR